MNQPVKTFIIYAHEDISVRDRLRNHLHVQVENGSIDLWGDHEIKPGEDWDKKITERLAQSELLILLLSADFFVSNYVRNKELPEALRRHESGECRLLPVIARDCDWAEHPVGKIQAVPSEGRPIDSTDWPSKDTPYRQVVEGIKTAVREIREEKKQLAAEEDAKKQQEREDAAKAKAEGIAYDEALSENTEQGWEGFLKKYPQSIFSAEAQKRLDTLAKKHGEAEITEKTVLRFIESCVFHDDLLLELYFDGNKLPLDKLIKVAKEQNVSYDDKLIAKLIEFGRVE